MKKLIAIILTTLMLLSCLTACSSGKTLADIEKAGKLPIDRKRVLATALGVGIAAFLILCGGGAFIW